MTGHNGVHTETVKVVRATEFVPGIDSEGAATLRGLAAFVTHDIGDMLLPPAMDMVVREPSRAAQLINDPGQIPMKLGLHFKDALEVARGAWQSGIPQRLSEEPDPRVQNPLILSPHARDLLRRDTPYVQLTDVFRATLESSASRDARQARLVVCIARMMAQRAMDGPLSESQLREISLAQTLKRYELLRDTDYGV